MSPRKLNRPARSGPSSPKLCHEEGLIIGAIGDVVAFCLPLIITSREIDDLFDRFGRR
jgi:4-aminobutyrate---pyruvate transaminase